MRTTNSFKLVLLLAAILSLVWLPGVIFAQTVTPTQEPTPTPTLIPTPTLTPTPSLAPTPSVSPTLTLNSTPPPATFSATLIINNGAPNFVDPLLNLAISSSTDSATLKGMRFSQDNGATWTNQEPFSSSKQLPLPADATWDDKTVTVEVRDLADNLATASATATYVSANKASMQLKTSYSFNVALDYELSTISTVQTINIKNTSGDWLSTLNLSVLPKAFGEFNLGTVKIDGREVTPNWSNNSNLVVDFGKNIRKNDNVTVEISFVENPTNDTSTYLKSALSKANGIMQVSQWFPIISDGHPLRMPGDSQFSLVSDNFHMELTLNRSMPLAAPGTVLSPSTLKRTVDFEHARDFAFSVCPACKTSTDTIDGIKVKAIYLSGSGGATAFTNAKNALHNLNMKFPKYPYPYDTFIIAQATRPKTANEFPGIIFVGDTWLESLNTVRHEVSHQWFYGLLGNDQMNEPWLDEAFAEWAGREFTARNYCLDNLKLVSSSIYDFPDRFDWSTSGCNSYDQTIYYKGSTFIEGVRNIMGDTTFFNSLNNLFANYKFGVITTSIVAQNWLDYAPSEKKRNSLKSYMKDYINW